MKTPSISTIICTYAADRWDALVAAVGSVQRQDYPPSEIIVAVDHNPTLAERLRAEVTGVVIVENSEHRGLSGARNSGVRVATSEVVAFLDDDAVADQDWLRWIARGYADPNVAGVGGSIVPSWASVRPPWFPMEFDWVVGCTYKGMPDRPSRVRNLIGANMSFRSDLFEAIGGFRSGIGRIGTVPVGCEETEFCIRVRQRYPMAVFHYDPRARISHFVPASRANWSYFVRRCYAEGRSKTAISRHVGASDALATERRYTTRTLPAGVVRELSDSVRHADVAALSRGASIIAGLCVTTLGFGAGQVKTTWKGFALTDAKASLGRSVFRNHSPSGSLTPGVRSTVRPAEEHPSLAVKD